ncbi:MAG: glycosyltransferase family 2 protein [Propioniciclava sp.]
MIDLRASFVIPVLNEERYVAAAIESVLAQRGLAEREILVVLGQSTDRTDEVVTDLAQNHPEIRILHNPQNAISRSMNLGIRAAQFPVIVRVDAHASLPVDYAATAIRTLREVGAVNVGGRMLAQGETPFEQAVAWGYNTPAGLGGAIYHTGGEAGPAESAYLGVFDREAVLAVDGFDESLSRGEDWDLNHRLIAHGGLVWFDPALEVSYRPRSTLTTLARQFHASGRWRGEIIRRLRGRVPTRYFMPGALVLTLAGGVGLILNGTVGRGSRPRVVTGSIPWIVYGLWLGSSVGRADLSPAARQQLLLVLPTMHMAWGSGALLGIVKPSRGPNAFAGR